VKSSKLVGIHQPNFLPWIGFFNKLVMADIFILLDDVQFPKGGGSGNWTNRHLILYNGKERWATVPVSRNFSGLKNINEIRFAQGNNWKRSYLEIINNSYSKAKYFSEIFHFLELSLNYETEFLSELNIHLIHSVLQVLQISNKTLIKSSDLGKKGKSNDLLCSLVQTVGSDSYLCGAGASGYFDVDVFEEKNIKVIYQNYKPIIYPQLNRMEFTGRLSIVDAMMNCGLVKTQELVLGESNV
jgi:hypothetical protein